MDEFYFIILLLLLAPIVIIILLAMALSRTNTLRRQVARLEAETDNLYNIINLLRKNIAAEEQDLTPRQEPAKTAEANPQSQPVPRTEREREPEPEAEPEPEPEPEQAQPDRPMVTPAQRQAAYQSNNNQDITRQAARAGQVQAATLAAQNQNARPVQEPLDNQQNTNGAATQAKQKEAATSLSLEDIIGGKLPIWIGGIALIFAAFFLVRYSIEAGLFGPRARTITATIFGLITIAMAQFGTRLPRIGFAFAEDERIGQSLAGAGIAILYATLYMASELYELLPIWAAFILVVVISALAFALAVRHGPPTAIMGVVGGFTAPFIAGLDASNLPLLLSYLGVVIVALCALSLWQRWLWMLFMSVIGGGIWTLFLVLIASDSLAVLGVFIIAIAILAIATALRLDDVKDAAKSSENGTANAQKTGLLSGFTARNMAIALPQILVLLQLWILLPRMDFSPLGWAFLFTIGALSLALAWRYSRLTLLAGMAATGMIIPIISGWVSGAQANMMLGITFGYAALFAGTALARLYREGAVQDKIAGWAFLALLPIMAAYMMIIFQYAGPLSAIGIGFIGLIMALPCLWVAWFLRGNVALGDHIQTAIAAICTIMLGSALIMILPGDYLAIIAIILALAAFAWGCFIAIHSVGKWGYAPLAMGVIAMLIAAEAILDQILMSFVGAYIQHDLLPAPSNLILTLLLPAVIMAAAAFAPKPDWGPSPRNVLAIIGAAFLGLYLALLTKQPLAITTLEDFTQWGFIERSLITLGIAGAGLGLLCFARGKLQIGGAVLIGITMARFIWFDIFVFNPVLREQTVGAVPVFNMAVLLCAALTGIFWWAGKQKLAVQGANISTIEDSVVGRLLYFGTLMLAIITILVLVRQYIQGSVIALGSGDSAVGVTENYLYSAALLLLALAWIGYAIMRGGRTLRLAGLGLLTLVTLKVFLIDAAAMQGLLRILSFLGLGVALIVIGWAYRRLLLKTPEPE